jgi:type IV secretory pathway VirB2 component (pilin)
VQAPGEIVSTSNEVILVALAVLFAALCFARTATFRRRLGRSPWGIHPNLWLVIGFLLGPIGACLALLACVTTRVGPAFGTPMQQMAGYQSGGTPWSSAPAPHGGPPAGWYPDPSGRHEYRFFTGHDWTADVVDNGAHSTEPLPAPPSA